MSQEEGPLHTQNSGAAAAEPSGAASHHSSEGNGPHSFGGQVSPVRWVSYGYLWARSLGLFCWHQHQAAAALDLVHQTSPARGHELLTIMQISW